MTKAKKTIHIIGAGPEQTNAIKFAKSLGCKVITTDYDPKAAGFKYADQYKVISTADLKANLKFAKIHKAQAVVAVVSEAGVPTAAYIAEKMGLPGLSVKTARFATDKNAMKKRLEECGVSVPRSMPVKTVRDLEKFSKTQPFPIILKPAISSAQRGITVLKSRRQFEKALKKAKKFSADGIAIAEEFMTGREINVQAYVDKGRFELLCVSDRVTRPESNFITTQQVAPPDVSKEKIKEVVEIAEKATRVIGIKDGISFPQIIYGKDGPKIMEIAARVPGGGLWEIAYYVSGIRQIEVAVLKALGINKKRSELEAIKKYPAAVTQLLTKIEFSSLKNRVKNISGLDRARRMPGVKVCYSLIGKGDKVPPMTSGAARFGMITAVGRSRNEAHRRALAALKKIKIS